MWCLSSCLYAATVRSFPVPETRTESPTWDLSVLEEAPEVYEADLPGLDPAPGIRSVYFEGLPYEGKPTRVFAWIGLPEVSRKVPVPGIVLVHGGGGTAYHDWVKLWVERGYAAIAIDTTGSVPESTQGFSVASHRHAYAGPPSRGGGFADALKPIADQWLYHAVADVMLAHSLLASLPQVDADRIGITGISWGGVITEISVGIDGRFRFAAPVYGCGYLGENSHWLETVFQELPAEKVERWIALWDPSQYLGRAGMPMLFCNGTNDKHFRPDSWQKTYDEVPGDVFLSMKIRMPHSHPPAGDPMEILRFANAVVRDGPPLAKITAQEHKAGEAWVCWEQTVPVESVELVYTTDDGNWVERAWRSKSADVEACWCKASTGIPAGTTAYFFNLKDAQGCIVSSEMVQVDDLRRPTANTDR